MILLERSLATCILVCGRCIVQGELSPNLLSSLCKKWQIRTRKCSSALSTWKIYHLGTNGSTSDDICSGLPLPKSGSEPSVPAIKVQTVDKHDRMNIRGMDYYSIHHDRELEWLVRRWLGIVWKVPNGRLGALKHLISDWPTLPGCWGLLTAHYYQKKINQATWSIWVSHSYFPILARIW